MLQVFSEMSEAVTSRLQKIRKEYYETLCFYILMCNNKNEKLVINNPGGHQYDYKRISCIQKTALQRFAKG